MNWLFVKAVLATANARFFLSRRFRETLLFQNTFPRDVGVALDVPDQLFLSGEKLMENSLVPKDIVGDGFLYAVPKRRRTVEKRLLRKLGYGKMHVPKKNIISCDTCGNFHIVNTVCGKCYERVKNETEIMQEAIFKQLKLDPIEEDVIVLYKDDERSKAVTEGKRIIELEKNKPAWFSKNLLTRDSETSVESSKGLGSHQPQAVVKK